MKEAIILAGGLGTRLRAAVPELPKCMAPINGKPFIAYVIDHLKQQGIERFILSLGYKSEVLIDYFQQLASGLDIHYAIEKEPLGTGGAIQLACHKTMTENVVVTNGDTLFKVNIPALAHLHLLQKSDCTLSLKPMKNFERYGVVELNSSNHTISLFKEKQFYTQGYINGGLYALKVNAFLEKKLPERFSFEKDYLEKYYTDGNMVGSIQDEYFIDIGIPEDYNRAKNELV